MNPPETRIALFRRSGHAWRARSTSYIRLDILKAATVVKPIRFLGTSLEDLRDLPTEARRTAGFQLHKIQDGNPPDDWKPMHTVGRGVIECRIREASGAYRLVYLATLPEAICVLHVFRKSTARTSRLDLMLAQKRYRELMRSRE